MASYFGKHDLHDTLKVTSGIGSITIDVPFVPDYIKVDFHGGMLSSKADHMDRVGDDDVYWNLTPATHGYQLSIGWSVFTEERKIFYRVARLIVDPV